MLLFVPVAASAGEPHVSTVAKVYVVGDTPFRLHIDTDTNTAPQVQMVAAPDRLVIDIPNAVPGARLRRLTVNGPAVKAVRSGLYSKNPPITRVVIDLTLPQWYRVVPDEDGLLVAVGGGPSAPADSGTTIGWVATKSPLRPANGQRITTTIHSPAPSAQSAAPVNGVSVDFANGMLTIHAANATLAEILFQVQKKTGAEIAIPSGTEQERVAADFGPGTPSEVLGQLLNGSGLNFVVVGSESDPKTLRSVILSRKGPDVYTPPQPAIPPVAQNTQPEDDAVPPPEPSPGPAPTISMTPPPPGS